MNTAGTITRILGDGEIFEAAIATRLFLPQLLRLPEWRPIRPETLCHRSFAGMIRKVSPNGTVTLIPGNSSSSFSLTADRL
jgi:hypothetical protein